jgi:hypothetical protein
MINTHSISEKDRMNLYYDAVEAILAEIEQHKMKDTDYDYRMDAGRIAGRIAEDIVNSILAELGIAADKVVLSE